MSGCNLSGLDLHGDAGEASSRHHGDSEVSWGLQQRPHDADRGNDFADVKITTIFNKDTAMFSVFRLIILPAAALVVGLGLDAISLGISVLMTGMPAGATAAIFAARYDSDALFATRCVVMTTLMSMLTLPVWCYLAG